MTKRAFRILQLSMFLVVLVAFEGGAAGATASDAKDEPNAASGADAVQSLAALGAWTPTGALSTAREGHSATLLPDGRVLAIAAGITETASPAEGAIEVYDPAKGSWQTLISLRPPRRGHTATLLPTGRVLIAGGDFGPDQAYATESLLFDPATNAVTATGGLATPRALHVAVALRDGRVVVLGGGNPGFLASVEVYNPTTGAWATIGQLKKAREFHTATLMADGTILVVGGAGVGGRLTSIERFNVATGTSTEVAQLTSSRGYHSTTLLPDGRVLIAGGDNGSGDGFPPKAEIFDPVTNTVRETAAMLRPRRHHTATLLPDGQVLVVGGDRNSPLAETEVYDPELGRWSTGPTLNAARRFHSATLLQDGRVLAAGGYGAAGRLASAEVLVGDQANDEFVEGQLIVVFQPTATEDAVRALYRERMITEVKNLARSPRYTGPAMRLVSAEIGRERELAAELARDPRVQMAGLNWRVSIINHNQPNDSKYSAKELWGLHNTGQNSGTNDADIDAPEAWHLATGASSPVIFVVDTGVDYTHPDLDGNIWINPNETAGNSIDDDNNGYIDDVHGMNAILGTGDPKDEQGHGTHVAGTIGAEGNNGIGVVGVNWSAKIGSCKFLNPSGNSADAIECVNYINDLKRWHSQDVRVVNHSWGWRGSPDPGLEYAMSGAGFSTMSPILHVVAAGNYPQTSPADNDVGFPGNTNYPASFALPNILSVAASDRNDGLATFTHYGATSVDIAAPGADIASTWLWSGMQYKNLNGTSMAAPHVTGCANLVASVAPALTAVQIKKVILDTGDYIGHKGSNASKPTLTNARLNCWRAVGGDAWVEDTGYDYAANGTHPDNGTEVNPNPDGYGIWKSRGIWVRRSHNQPGTYADFRDHQDPEFGQQNDAWVKVRNSGSTIAMNVKVEVWRSFASLASTWPTLWVPLGSITVNIPPGESNVNIPWFPPGLGHYCLVARLVSSEDPMHVTETTSIGPNTISNNNIAWRNVEVHDNLKKPIDKSTFILRNISPDDRVVDMRIDDHGQFLKDGGIVVVDLGRAFAGWLRSGASGQNVQRTDGTLVRLTGAPALFSGIPMKPSEEADIWVQTEASSPMPGRGVSRSFVLDAVELIGGREVGGLSMNINTRAQDSDTDADGTPDIKDNDDDNDGVPDAGDANPVDPKVGPVGPRDCVIDLLGNSQNCQGIPGISFVTSPANGQSVVKLTLDPKVSGFSSADFAVDYDTKPTGFSLNIGDSQSNDGFGGDSGHQSNSAELQVSDGTLSIFGNDDLAPQPLLLREVKDAATERSSLLFTVGNEYLGWKMPGATDALKSKNLFALAGQPDREGTVNYDIYAAFNRSIGAAGRTGTGAKRVRITLLPPPFTPVASGTLSNISTRGMVGTGDKVMIGGFIVSGAPVKVVMRALGPSLAASGVPGPLQDPTLRLFSGQTVIGENDNWQAGNCKAEAPEGLWPKDPRESCLVMTLAPGPYTGIVSGVSGTTGIGLVEAFHSGGTGELTNISTRGDVQTGDRVMIGGFIARGAPVKLVLRALGPSLAARGVPGTLCNPRLQLYSGQTVIAESKNWSPAPDLPPSYYPSDAREAVIVADLPPGPYTAIVTAEDACTGIGLVEVFKTVR